MGRLRIHKASEAREASDRTSTSFWRPRAVAHLCCRRLGACAPSDASRSAAATGARRGETLKTDGRLGAATLRLVSAIECEGAEEVAHGKADDEFVCKYRIFLQRRCEHACVRVSRGFRQRFAGPPRSAPSVWLARHHGSRSTKARSSRPAGVCSPSMPMAGLLERLASTLLLSIPDPFVDTATLAPRPANEDGKLAF